MVLQLMKITCYTDEEFQTPFEDPSSYSLMINPDTIKQQRTIDYNSVQAPDTSSSSQKFKSSPSDKLSFDIVIDCTGVVDPKRTSMFKEVTALENIVSKYNGEIHRPNFVSIQWGSNPPFKGVLTSFDVSYTLFRPDGSPLRAKISLSFNSYVSPKTAARQNNNASPDVTHLVDVEQGVTLPQLCQQVWKNSNYYVQVAKYNDLNKFRNMEGTEQLIFPPIIQPS
jgi:hypothetical protein